MSAETLKFEQYLAARGLNFSRKRDVIVKAFLKAKGHVSAEELHRLFERKPGATEVRFRLEKSKDFTVLMDVGAKVRPDKEFQAEVARICGPEAYEVLASFSKPCAQADAWWSSVTGEKIVPVDSPIVARAPPRS